MLPSSLVSYAKEKFLQIEEFDGADQDLESWTPGFRVIIDNSIQTKPSNQMIEVLTKCVEIAETEYFSQILFSRHQTPERKLSVLRFVVGGFEIFKDPAHY